MLGLTGPTCLVSNDGCEVENDDGLFYAATKDKVIFFRELTNLPTNQPSTNNSSTSAQPCEPWPAIYKLPKIDEVLKMQIKACKTPEDASKLKCNTAFCNNFLRPIVNDVQRFTGEER